MKKSITPRNVILAAALAATAATAWAANEALSDSVWVPYTTYTQPYVAPQPQAAPQPEPVVLSDGETLVADPLPSNERVTPLEAAAIPRTTTTYTQYTPQPQITVETRRLSEDERIQATVMDALAQAPNLSGKIGVESHDRVVTLSGYTLTAGQASRAERYARDVRGVRYVQNEIRARIGGSV
jgi:hypothetical protein